MCMCVFLVVVDVVCIFSWASSNSISKPNKFALAHNRLHDYDDFLCRNQLQEEKKQEN